MDPMTLMLILGGTGLAKSQLIDRPKEQRQRKLAAETALYSPWTGMQPGQVQEADPFGSTLQGVTAGAMYGQQAQQNDMAKEELAMKKDYYKSLSGNNSSPALGASGYAGTPSLLDDSMSFKPRVKQNPYGYSWAN